MGPFAAMMIMQGISAVMKHQGDKAAAAAQRAWKFKKDQATLARLKIQQGFSRQAFADTNLMRVRNMDIKADVTMENRLNEMRVASSLKASGIPLGQSTDNLGRQAVQQVLKGEASFLKEMEMKTAQLNFRDRGIQQGMDMAWLDAKAQISGTSYQKDPGYAGLAMNLGSSYMESKAYGKKMNNKWS
jgi:hypothetical protein